MWRKMLKMVLVASLVCFLGCSGGGDGGGSSSGNNNDPPIAPDPGGNENPPAPPDTDGNGNNPSVPPDADGDGGGNNPPVPPDTDGDGDGNDPPTPPVIVPPAYKTYGLNAGFFQGTQDPNMGAYLTLEQVRERMAIIASYTEWVRAFGSTGGSQYICQAAKEKGLKCAAGAWLGKDLAANEMEIRSLIEILKKGQAEVAIVGSEVLYRGDLSENQLLDYMDRVMAAVPSVPVTTGEINEVLLEHPAVTQACDFLFVNYYPYWSGVGINHAIASLHEAHRQMIKAAGGKEVIVSETGWPSGGNSIGQAVPSLLNASNYFLNFVSWARANKVNFFYFEAFDEPWKAKYEGPQGAYWGIWDAAGNMKSGYEKIFNGATMADNWSGVLEPGGPGIPEMQFTSVPEYGSFHNLEGQVWHVKPAEYRVVVYIYVAGSWWIKPTYANPKTVINPDGSFFTDITTGGIDHLATRIAAYLIPAAYAPPGTYDKAVLDANSVASLIVLR